MFWWLLLLVLGCGVGAFAIHALSRPKISAPEKAQPPVAVVLPPDPPAWSAAARQSDEPKKVESWMVGTGLIDRSIARKETTLEEHQEIAYWAVMTDLQLGDVPLSRLNDLKPKVLGLLSAGPKAVGSLINAELADIAWDCPAWNALPKRDRGESASESAAGVTRMKPAVVLERAWKADLQALCKTHSVRITSKTTKPQMIAELGLALNAKELSEIVEPIRARLVSAETGSSRAEIAEFVASRISSIAYNAYRYEQLSGPEFAALRPFWKFIWVDYGDAPRACKKFDGKILPIDQAKQRFPRLPCNRLRCHCRLHAVETKSG